MPEINVDLVDDNQTIEVPINAIFGTGIERIETTHTSTGDGDPNIITIYLTNDTQYSFAVYNGVNGRDGVDGTNGRDGVDGTDGVDGITPVASLSTGTSWDGRVYHTLTIQALPQYVVSTQIYDGLDGTNGTNGTNGQDGYSPTVVVTDITGGHQVTITDVNGPHTFDVMDGTGGGGSSDYDDLTDKPSINSVTLSGNQTTSQLGIYDIYWATYNSTTSANIEAAYQAGKEVCVIYDSKVYTLRYRSSATNHRFICFYGGKQYELDCQSDVWMPGATMTFLTSAPVSSVNGQTGAVTIGNATTSAAGLMSATDKSHLDDVYADYSSALAALGV